MDYFDRNVWCLLGLPFDAIDLKGTVQRVHDAAKDKTSCFISTPNLNFLITSQKDAKFRDSVINSDLSIADGKPLIWIARLLRIPIPERVAGSDLIEALIENKEGYKPLRVFFFGGQDGIAEQACEKLNAQNKGLHCVGFHSPGFGSIEDMSSVEVIDKINQSGADFVIVALGAKKGQAWIEYNKNKLEAPIISHLGAVVNFIAGNVKRSPKLLQRLGLEWLWRIKEEPTLWSRYFMDGMELMYILILKIIPLYLLSKKTDDCNEVTSNIDVLRTTDSTTIIMNEQICSNNYSEINSEFSKALAAKNKIILIFECENCINSFMIGKILILKKELYLAGCNLEVRLYSKLMKKIFRYHCCEYLLG